MEFRRVLFRSGAGLAAVPQAADRVADGFVHGLRQAAELADVAIDPARVLGGVLAGDEHHLGLQADRRADNAAARLEDRAGVALGTSVAVRGARGGRPSLKKTKTCSTDGR